MRIERLYANFGELVGYSEEYIVEQIRDRNPGELASEILDDVSSTEQTKRRLQQENQKLKQELTDARPMTGPAAPMNHTFDNRLGILALVWREAEGETSARQPEDVQALVFALASNPMAPGIFMDLLNEQRAAKAEIDRLASEGGEK